MARALRKSTIYLDPDLIGNAVKSALAEDAEDLKPSAVREIEGIAENQQRQCSREPIGPSTRSRTTASWCA